MRTMLYALVTGSMTCSLAVADVITVDDDGPADYSTIQDAINAAQAGDEIQVQSGNYEEAIDFLGKAIEVVAVNGPLETGLRAPAKLPGPTVTFFSGEGTGSMLSGFKIGGGTGGFIDDPVFGSSLAGGGIYCVDASPMIFNCTLVGNVVDGSGGGMAIVRGNPWIIDCSFVQNEASSYGGGLYILDNSSPNVTGCLFERNSGSWGGGVACTVSCNPTFSDCSFMSNVVVNVGGGMYVRSSSSPLLTNCRFDDNVQQGNPFAGGAGFTVYGSGNGGGPCYPELVGCSFVGNDSEAFGGAIHAAYAGNAIIRDCSFDRNSADKSGGAIALVGNVDVPTFVTITSCTFDENASVEGGGGLHSRVSTVDVQASYFRNNVSGIGGGGCDFDGGSAATIANTVFCGNLPEQTVGSWTDDGGNSESEDCAPVCATDLNGDGFINGADLTILLAAWGDCEVIECTGDLSGDGSVGGADLTILLSDWGVCD